MYYLLMNIGGRLKVERFLKDKMESLNMDIGSFLDGEGED